MKKVTDIENGGLQFIYRKLNALRAIEEKIQPYIPEDIRDFCRLANLENGVLKFAVPSSMWGTRLRYCSSELLDNLRKNKHFSQLHSIIYYIEPEFNKIFKQK
jgi:hypothetical protein